MVTFTTATIIGAIIIIFAFSQNLCILIYHIFTTISSIKKQDEKLSRIYLISIISMFLILLSNSINIISYFSLISHKLIECKWQINIQLISYIYSKICLYILFLERLFSVFSSSNLEFNKSKIFLSRIFLLLLLIFYTIMIYLFSNGIYNIKLNQCNINHPIIMNITAGICDFITILTILILFSRRLWMLSHRITLAETTMSSSSRHDTCINNSNNSMTISCSSNTTPTPLPTNRLKLKQVESNSISNSISFNVHHMIQLSLNSLKWNADELLLSVLRKTTILNIIAVISTAITMMLCGYFQYLSTIWISIDSIVNYWCILLMFKSYEKLFDILCGCISNRVSDECLSCCSCHCFCSILSYSNNNNDNNENENDNNQINEEVNENGNDIV